MKRRNYNVIALISLFLSVNVAQSQTFKYPEDTRPSSLLPFFAEGMSSVRMVELIFESLVIINKRGEVEGALATSWKVDADNMGIRFVLRENVRWHNDKPFAADDVVFTVKAAQDPKTIFNAKSKFTFIKDVIPEGQYSIRFTFDRPINDAEKKFLFKIIPMEEFGGNTAIQRNNKFNRKPIGTGPYKIDKYTMRNISLLKNDKYWGKVNIPEISMQHTPDKSVQVKMLQYSGDTSGLQAVIFIPPKNIPIFENDERVVLEPYHTVSWWYLAFNHKNSAIGDPVVREAIALAINRQDLVEAHLGRGDILSGPFTESSPFYNFDVEIREQNIEKANQMLDEAGYKKKGNYRKKGSKKLKFLFVMDKELASAQALFLGIQAQLKKIGIETDPKYLDHAGYREKVFTKGSYDMTIHVWSFEEVEDIYPLFHSRGVMNFINYKNDQVDKLLDQSKTTKDYKQYKEQMKKLHAVLNKDLPYMFLWSLDIYSGINKNVKNVFIQPYYYFTSFKEWNLN